MSDDKHQENLRAQPRAPSDAGWALSAAGRETAEAYLKEQTRLAHLQADELVREDAIRHWSLRFSHASAILKLAFELALALIFLIVAGVIVGAVWSAHEANGLVIEAFQVPAPLADRGLSGQAVAARLLDKVSRLQSRTDSLRAPNSYENNWGDDIKVQIPDTGVSIGELNRYLRQWLGHETHITGEVWREGDGIAVVARAGADEGTVFTGKESELDALLEKAAEDVYEKTQPYRAAVHYRQSGRQAKSDAILRAMLLTAPRSEKAWVLSLLSADYFDSGDLKTAVVRGTQAMAFDPENALAVENRAEAERELSWDDAALRDFRRSYELIVSPRSDINPAKSDVAMRFVKAETLQWSGDLKAALDLIREIESMPDYAGSAANSRAFDMLLAGELHDSAAVAAIAGDALPADRARLLYRLAFQTQAQTASGDLPSAIASYRQLVAAPLPADAAGYWSVARNTMPRAAYAVALAGSGDAAAARAAVDTTPVDCDACMIARGRIAASAGQWDRAGFWFAAAEKHAPSLPFADESWGRALLAKGDVGGARAKFEASHRKGPHYADALEGMGEALVARNRSDLALAKFEEAAKYAPNWKRLHQKWGEALTYLGRKDEAAKQFALARSLNG
jgi:tetratricopeptide (TPR) repeat protein